MEKNEKPIEPTNLSLQNEEETRKILSQNFSHYEKVAKNKIEQNNIREKDCIFYNPYFQKLN